MKGTARSMMDQLFEHTRDMHSQRRICIALPHPAAAAPTGKAAGGTMPDDTLSISRVMGPADPRRGLATVVVTEHPGGAVGGAGSYTHVAMLDTVNHANEHYTQRHFVASFIKLAKIAVASKLGGGGDCVSGGPDGAALHMEDFDTVKISPSTSFYWGMVATLGRRTKRFSVGMAVHTLRHLPAGSSRGSPLVLPPLTSTDSKEEEEERGCSALAEWLDQKCNTIKSKNRFPSFCESWPPQAT